MTGIERSAFAVLTPPGRGGIAVIRCSGPDARRVLRACFRPTTDGAALPPVGGLAYGHIADADGRPLDEVILCRAARAACEVNCHGGPAAVAAVCAALAALVVCFCIHTIRGICDHRICWRHYVQAVSVV